MNKKETLLNLTVPIVFFFVLLFIRVLFLSPTGYDVVTEDALNICAGKGIFTPMFSDNSSGFVLRSFIPVIAGVAGRIMHTHPGLIIRIVFPFINGTVMLFLYSHFYKKAGYEKRRYVFGAISALVVIYVFSPLWSSVFIFAFIILPAFVYTAFCEKKMVMTGLLIVLTVLMLSDAGTGRTIPGSFKVFDLKGVHCVLNKTASDKEMKELADNICNGMGEINLIGEEKAMSELPEITLQIKTPFMLRSAGRPTIRTGLSATDLKLSEGASDDLYLNDFAEEKLAQHAKRYECNCIVTDKKCVDADIEMFEQFGYIKSGETEHYYYFIKR